MDFTGQQIVVIMLLIALFFTVFLFIEHMKKQKLNSIEQTTYEPWMEYDNHPPEDVDVYKELREKFLANYLWAVKLFGSNWDLMEKNLEAYLDDRLMFNYHGAYHMYEYYRYLPTCFRNSDFESKVELTKKRAYGTRGAEDFMREFNVKVQELKDYSEKHALEIKYGLSHKFPTRAMVNCLLLCDGQSYYEYQFKKKSQLREDLLKEGFNVREFTVQNYTQGG